MNTGERFSRLYSLLEQQEDVITDLISAAREQTECLRRNDARGLQPVVLRQETLAARLRALEDERVQVQQELEKSLGFPAGATLADLADGAGEPAGSQLKEIGNVLLEKLNRLREINALNRALNRQALHFTGMLLDIIQPSKAVYTSDGDKKETSGRHFILDRTI